MLFLTLLVLPFQLGKHFWPFFAFVSGQRVDYLSPTLYLSDVFLFAVFLFSIPTFFRRLNPFFYVSLALLSLGIFFSQSPAAGWYSLLKGIELVFLAWAVLHEKRVVSFLFWSFLIGFLIEGVLGVLQFIHQGSINGLWYILGERTFSAATPGIANASIHGQLVLRPYATFPHPNVFAGYLVIILLFFLLWTFARDALWQKISGIILLFLGTCVLLLTLSRVAIVVWVGLGIFLAVLHFHRSRYTFPLLGVLFLGFIGILTSDTFFSGRFLVLSAYTQSLSLRELLQHAAVSMTLAHPLLGVGLGNFLVVLPQYLSGQLLFGFLQPVHNIFLLILAETGVTGLLLFLFMLFMAFWHGLLAAKASRNTPLSLFPVSALLAVCLIGLTDHYFLTLQQGQLLFALVLGLCFSHGTIQLWPFITNLPKTHSTKL